MNHILLTVVLIFVSALLFVVADDKKIAETYELSLTSDDEDVQKLVNDGWNQLVSRNINKGASRFAKFFVKKAKVQVVEDERRYTILVKYNTWLEIDNHLHCYLLVWTKRANSLFIDCWRGYAVGGKLVLEHFMDQPQYDFYSYLNDNM